MDFLETGSQKIDPVAHSLTKHCSTKICVFSICVNLCSSVVVRAAGLRFASKRLHVIDQIPNILV